MPQVEWGRYLCDLVVLELALVFGDAIGYAGEYPFHLQVKDNTPLFAMPRVLLLAQRSWVCWAIGKM